MLAATRDVLAAFDRDTALQPLGSGRYTGLVAPGWNVGPAPNGGYLVALAGAALRAELERPDVLTVTTHFLRPAHEGPLEIEVEPLRVGRRHATARARVLQDGKLALHVVATLGDLDQARGPSEVLLRPPPIPRPDECVPTEATCAELPVLRDHVEIRLAPETATWITEGRPSGRAEIGGWIRFRDRRPLCAPSLAFFSDCFPPAVRNLATVKWSPTVELTVHTRGRPQGEWMQVWFRGTALVEGYLEENGELWDETGRLVGMSRQLALVMLHEGT